MVKFEGSVETDWGVLAISKTERYSSNLWIMGSQAGGSPLPMPLPYLTSQPHTLPIDGHCEY